MGKSVKKVILSLLTAAALFAMVACGDPKPDEDLRSAAEIVYAQATDLGYEGTLDEFLALVAGEDGKDGKDGANGKSAYELAKENGYTGTEAQWVASLKGKDGLDGQTPTIGANGNWFIGNTDTGVKASGTNGKDGAQGEKGDKGDKGDPGENGTDGKDGAQGEKGDKGDKGDPGENGTDGKDGAQGEKGDKGDAGVGISSIKQEYDKWGIMMTIVYQMTDGSEIRLDPVDLGTKWYVTYEASDSEELSFLLSKHAMQIKLTADIVLSESVVLDQQVMIDLNGFTLSYADAAASLMLLVSENVNVSLFNGKISRSGNQNGNAIAVRNGASLEMENVEVDSVGFGLVITSGAYVSVNNCEITAHWHAIGTNNQQGGAQISVTDSKIVSTGDAAVFISSATQANFQNSAIEGYSAFHILMGEIYIQNCTVTATYESYNPYTAATIKKSGTKETEGAAFVLRTNLYYDKGAQNNNLSLVVDDLTTINAKSGVNVSLYDCADANKFLAAADPATVTDQFDAARQWAEQSGLSTVRTWVYDGTALNEIEIVSASTLEEVNAALALGKSVSLTADLDVTAPIEFTKNSYIRFYGNGHTVTNTSTVSGARVFNLDGEDYVLDGISLNIYNVNAVVKNASSSTRGINIYQVKDANVTLDGCNFDVSYYAINLSLGVENLNLRVTNSEISGWAALNSYSNNSNLYFENSILRGTNDKGVGASNSFATIVFDGDPDEVAAGTRGSRNTVVAKNCEIASVETNSNRQYHLSLQYGAIDNSISVTDCTFTVNGETKEPELAMTSKENLQNSIKIDGVEQLV